MAYEIGTGYVTVMPSAKGFFSGLSKDAEAAGKSSGGGFASKFGSVLSGGAIAGVAASVFGKVQSTISDSLNGAFARADILNSFPRTMQSLGFSAEEAGASIGSIKDHLNGLPSSTQAVASFVKQLTASTGNLSKATDLGLAFNDMMLAAGASTTDADNAMTQFNQMLAAGKVDQQAWNSVVSAAPGQLNQLAKAMLGPTANQKDLYEALKDGKISMDDFQDAIIKLGTEGADGIMSFADQAKAGSVGIGTSLDNVKNRVVAAVANIVSHIGVDKIAGAIDAFSGQFSKISDAAVAAIDIVGDAVARIAPDFNDLALVQIGMQFEGLGSAAGGLVGSLLSLGDEFIKSGAAADICNAAVGAVRDVIGMFTGPLTGAVEWLSQFLDRCRENGAVQSFASVLGGLFDIVGNVAEAIGNGIEHLKGFDDGSADAAGAADIFKLALDGLDGIVSAVGDATQWLADNAEALVPVVGAAAAGMTAFKTAMAITTAVEGARTALDGFMKAQNATRIGQALLNAVMSVNPFVLAATAIAAVVTALVLFFTKTELGRQIWSGFCEFFTGAVEAVGSFFSNVFDGICTFFTQTVPEAVNGFVTFFQTFPETVGGFLSDVLGRVGEWAAGIAQWALDAGSQFVTNVCNFFMGLPETISTYFTELLARVGEWAASMGQWAVDAGSQFLSGVVDFIAQLPMRIVTLLGFVIGFVAGFVVTIVAAAIQVGSQFLANVVNFFSQLPGKILEFVTNAAKNIAAWVSQTVSDGLRAGQQFLNNIVNFFRQLPGKVLTFLTNAARNIATWVTNTINDGLRAGQQFLNNVINFFKELPGKVWDWLNQTATKIATWVTETVNKGIEAGRDFVNKVIEFLRELPGKVFDWLNQTATKIATWVTETVNKGIEAGRDFVSKCIEKLKELPGKVWDWLNGALGKVGSFVTDVGTKAADAGKRFLDGVKDGFQKAVDFVKGIPGKCIEALGNIGGSLLDSGKSLITGFVDGIKNGFSAATDAVKNGIQAIRDFFPFSPAKKGPLSGHGYTTFSGRAMIGDWAKSITKATPEAVRSAMRAAYAVKDALEGGPEPILSAVADPVAGGAGGRTVNQTLVFNEPWRSPDQVARAIRLEERYGIAAAY